MRFFQPLLQAEKNNIEVKTAVFTKDLEKYRVRED